MRCHCCNEQDAKRNTDGKYYCTTCSSAIRETLSEFDLDNKSDMFYHRTYQGEPKKTKGEVSLGKGSTSTDSP